MVQIPSMKLTLANAVLAGQPVLPEQKSNVGCNIE